MKYKKRLHKGKVIITFIITVLVFYLPIKLYDDLVMNKYEQYTIIKEDNNENYAGQGQEKVLSRIGYFTLFHSKDGKTYKEYKQNYGPWKNKQYWCRIALYLIIFPQSLVIINEKGMTRNMILFKSYSLTCLLCYYL